MKYKSRRTPQEWIDELETLERECSGDEIIAAARQTAKEIEMRLGDVGCGAVPGGAIVYSAVNTDLLGSSQRVTRDKVIRFHSLTTVSYAFVNDRSLDLAGAKRVIDAVKTRCKQLGFDAMMAIRMGTTGWLVRVLGLNAVNLQDLIWDCWSAETKVGNAEVERLKKHSKRKCKRFPA